MIFAADTSDVELNDSKLFVTIGQQFMISGPIYIVAIVNKIWYI